MGYRCAKNFGGLAPQNWPSLGVRISGLGTDSRTLSSRLGTGTSPLKICTEKDTSGHSGMGQNCDVRVHRKNRKKSPISVKKSPNPIDILRGRRGRPPRSPRKCLHRESFCELVTIRSKKFSILGAGPQMGGGIPAWHGGICSTWGVLPYSVEISA